MYFERWDHLEYLLVVHYKCQDLCVKNGLQYRCDTMIHSANEYVAKHHRYLLSGVAVGLKAIDTTGNAPIDGTPLSHIKTPNLGYLTYAIQVLQVQTVFNPQALLSNDKNVMFWNWICLPLMAIVINESRLFYNHKK